MRRYQTSPWIVKFQPDLTFIVSLTRICLDFSLEEENIALDILVLEQENISDSTW